MERKGNFIKNLKIGKKLSLLMIVFIVCLIFVGAFSFYAINEIKINGELYREIVSGKDLIADILPPPEYIVESYAVALEMSTKSSMKEIRDLAEQMDRLRENYELRHQFWDDNLTSNHVRQLLLEDSYDPAMEFYKIAEEEYIPALLSRDTDKAQQLLTDELGPLYEQHLVSINKIATVVNEKNAAIEKSAAERIRTNIVVLSAVMALGLILVVVMGMYISRIISRPIRVLKEYADKLALGEVDLTIKVDTEDEIGELMNSFAAMVENTKKQAMAGEAIARGDLSIEIEPRSEHDVLALSMKSITETLRILVAETQALTLAAAEGNLATRGDAERFSGGFREIVEGINHTLDGIVDPLNTALAYIEKIADGEKLDEIENSFQGQYGILINHLMMVRASINLLLSETEKLTDAAFNGEFSYQPDISLHKGEYAKIMKSVNDALDYIIAPLKRAGTCMTQIGNGEIPEKIFDEYSGEFKDIIGSINDCIDGLGGLEASRDALDRMSRNDFTIQVSGSYRGIYAEIAGSVNLVSDRIRYAIDIMNHIAAGDLSDLNSLKELGMRSENDILMPAMIKMIENISALVDETAALADAAVRGNLDARSDSERFQGAWKNLVDGMNHILIEVAKPLKDVSEVMNEMSCGHLQTSVKGSYRGDFELLAKSINGVVSWLRNIVSEIGFRISQLADGNLALERMEQYQGDFVQISDSMNVIVDSLNGVMSDINDTADQVSVAAIQVSEGSQTLSQGSTTQACTIQELSSSISEIASQTKLNAVSASQASEIAFSAKDHAEKENEQMRRMLASMNEIRNSSTNISKIIKVIDDIAFQTNILALNAAVEAARAGQHGKGFAVVAEEVRNLAVRSADAAKETTELIRGSIETVQTGTEIANETAAALVEIVSDIEKSAELVSQIAKASNDQAMAITMVNSGLEQISFVVQNNSATAEQSAAASEEMAAQAQTLKGLIQKFKLKSKDRDKLQSVVLKLEDTGREFSKRITIPEYEYLKY